MATKKTIEMVEGAISQLRWRGKRTIWDAYKTCSSRKETAYLEIANRDGVKFTSVIGSTPNFFSQLSVRVDIETGEKLVDFDTYANTYTCSYAELSDKAQCILSMYC